MPQEIAVVRVDLAKNAVQVHVSDAQCQSMVRRWLRRMEVLKVFAELPPRTSSAS